MSVRLLPLVALLCLPLTASAEAIRVSLEGKAALGEGVPTLVIHIEEPIDGFEVKLKRSDGKAVELKGGGKPGISRRLALEQPEGKFHYEGELTVRFPGGAEPGSMPLSFDTELNGPLKLEVRPEDVDVPGRKLRFTLSRPAAKTEVTVKMDTGKTAFAGDVDFKGAPAGTPLEVKWLPAEGKVMHIRLRAYDTSDFYTGVDLYPWQVDIPHEEVTFASGRSDVPSAEKGKLDASYKSITEALNKYGRWASLRLYVLGHTDTVGSTNDNRELSLKRAKSIATYFRQRGLKVPVFYEGFGEQSPAVPTPDETAEAGNRRAEYIIAVEDPSLTNAPFAPRWRKP
ncbi:OmpA family protein [Corallococcus exiguus]|uniref:OmpA family protein n=1 Tax=Corallococcus exiguus TaxID=83462 RepID=A0A7X5BZ37_9BACT|nr:OmpA family protein [Corallococcus exiguus]NBC45977.1 OmpA family protein [Corallococcus exiguus]TNV65843.1 OmpA family protein [Corallococcus exiguus]